MTIELLDAPPRIVHETRLSGRALQALARHEVLAVRIPRFLSGPECDAVGDAIRAIGVEYYLGDTKADTEERKGKIGPNLFRFKDDLPGYFDRAREFESRDVPRLFREVNVQARFTDALSAAHWATSVMTQPATQGPVGHVRRALSAFGALSSCIVRDLPSAPPHVDWTRGELPHFDALADVLDQFAWNVYIAVGTAGGETLVYDHESPAAAQAGGKPALTVPPARGDLLLFRTRNVHAVRPTQGSRLTVSGFFGPTTDGTLKYWV